MGTLEARPKAMIRVAATLVTVVLLAVAAAGCDASEDPGTDGTAQPGASLPDSPDPSASTAPTEPATVRIPNSESELWFVQGERLSWGATSMGGEIPRELGDDPLAQRAAFWLQILVGGPTGPDQEAGATTAIPNGTQLLGVEREGSVLYVDLSSRFESGGGSLSMLLRVAQVVYTGTSFEGIDAVRILIDGKRVDAIGGEGVVTTEPLTRRDFQDVAPPVVVEMPKPGSAITSPVSVTGFANVFEANVNIRIRDASGKVIVETFTTATCGTGCWGDFSEQVAFEVAKRQEGRLEVLTYSAEDGSEQDVVSLPIVLLP